jgi:hypothetical protein
MSCFLYVTDEEQLGKVNIDDLYENKQRRDVKQVSIFNKILNRIHNRIKTTARNKKIEQHIWFVVPEYLFGEPRYDKAECIAYLVAKLEENQFHIRYVHPNTLFVSWSNWVPSYVRNEFKKKTGIIVDERGQIVEKTEDQDAEQGKKSGSSKTQKEYTPINKYKPTGNLVYSLDMFEKIEKKLYT